MRLPARPGYARLARIGAASIALRLGFPLRTIDDLRLALDEAMIMLLDSADPDDEVFIEYDGDLSEIVVRLWVSPVHDIDGEAEERFLSLTDGLVDGRQVSREDGVVSIHKSRPD